MSPIDIVENISYRKQPLQSQRRTPRPLVVSFVVSVGGTSDNNRANAPTHLESGSADTSKGERDNLRSVGRGVGNEETPWNTLEGLSHDEELQRVGLY